MKQDKKLKTKSSAELHTRANELRLSIAKNLQQHAVGKLKNTALLRAERDELARVQTWIHEQESAQQA